MTDPNDKITDEFKFEAESFSSDSQFRARQQLQDLFRETPPPPEDLMTNLGLYIRGSVLVKLLMLDEIYRKIIVIPGAILEFGSLGVVGHRALLFLRICVRSTNPLTKHALSLALIPSQSIADLVQKIISAMCLAKVDTPSGRTTRPTSNNCNCRLRMSGITY